MLPLFPKGPFGLTSIMIFVTLCKKNIQHWEATGSAAEHPHTKIPEVILCWVTQSNDSVHQVFADSSSCLQTATFALGSTVDALLQSLLSFLQFHIKIKRFLRTLQEITLVASKCQPLSRHQNVCGQYNFKPKSPYITFKTKTKYKTNQTNNTTTKKPYTKTNPKKTNRTPKPKSKNGQTNHIMIFKKLPETNN